MAAKPPEREVRTKQLRFIQFEVCQATEEFATRLYGLDEDFLLWVRLHDEELWRKVPMEGVEEE
jgi:hypothetical protein